MTYTHVAHDCRIGNHVILGNSVGLAGHVTIEDWADVSPFSGVHQFCRIGKHAFVGPYSVIKQDVMPYSLTSNQPEVQVFGANSIGLARRGFDKAAIESLQTAFRLLTRAGLNTSQAIERIQAEVEPGPEIEELLAFIVSLAARRDQGMKYGIIAGNGRFPVIALETARKQGDEAIAIAIKEEASKDVEHAAAAMLLGIARRVE